MDIVVLITYLIYELSRINTPISFHQKALKLLEKKHIGKRNIKMVFEQRFLQTGVFLLQFTSKLTFLEPPIDLSRVNTFWPYMGQHLYTHFYCHLKSLIIKKEKPFLRLSKVGLPNNLPRQKVIVALILPLIIILFMGKVFSFKMQK